MAKSIMVRVPPAAYEQVAKIIAQVRLEESLAARAQQLQEATNREIAARAQKLEETANRKSPKTTRP